MCGLCRGGAPRLKFFARDLLQEAEETFAVLQCPGCGLLSTQQSPGSFGARYPEDYHRRFAQPDAPDARRSLEAERLGSICRFKSAGRLLDVGCGDGSLLAALAQAGWEAFGTEVNGRIARTHGRQGKRVFEGELAALRLPPGSFDLITYFGSFEDVKEPREELRQVKRLLKQDGLLLLNVTNAGSWEARIFGAHWLGLEIPRHYFNFTAEALTRLLRRAGFSCLAAEVKHDAFITAFSLVHRLGLEAHFHRLRKPLALLLKPYAEAAGRLGQGNVIELTARPAS